MKKLLLIGLALVLSEPATEPVRYQVIGYGDSPPIEDVLRESDLIVIGRLRSAREWMEAKLECGRGVIDVSDVIWGYSAPGDSIVLEWRQHAIPFMSRPEGDLADLAAQESIWFLATTGIGTARTVTPRCTRPARPNVRAWIESQLAGAPAMIWFDSGWYVQGAPVTVALGYRNFGGEAREFPGLAFSDSILSVDPRVSVALKAAPVFIIHTRPGHLVSDESMRPIRVDAMSEHRVTIDLDTVFPMEGRNFLLTFAVQDCGKGWTRSLQVRSELPASVLPPDKIRISPECGEARARF